LLEMSQSHDPGKNARTEQPLLTCPRVEQVQSEVLAITKRYASLIKKVCFDASLARYDLAELEHALAAVGIRQEDQTCIASNRELRRFLGLLLLSRELESNGAYMLKDLDLVLAAHPQAFIALFSSPVVAQTLGAVLAAPTSFDHFNQNRDALPLELVTIKLRKTLPSEHFAEWQQGAVASLYWNYQGIQESPCPEVYARAVQITENMYVFNSEQMRDRVISHFHQLLRIGEPIPGALWETLSSCARREVSLRLPISDLLIWMEGRFQGVAQQAAKQVQACKKIKKSGHSGGREPEEVRLRESSSSSVIKSEFERSCATMLETCRFLSLYLDTRMKEIGDDPIRLELSQRRAGGKAVHPKDGAAYEDAKVRELVQKKIGKGVTAAMRKLCDCMASDSVDLVCSERFAQGVVELLDELDLYLDAEDEGRTRHGFYYAHLLPCFRRAIRNHDFTSARAIRMIFPPDTREAPTVKRFLVDDYIEACRLEITDALVEETTDLARVIDKVGARRLLCLPVAAEQRLRSFQGVLRHFPLERSIANLDLELLGTVAVVVRALISWDSEVEAREDAVGESRAVTEPVSTMHAFAGCRKAAELLAALNKSPAAQRCIMKAVFASSQPLVRQTLADFIVHTNFELVRALQAIASSKVILSDILPECHAAFDADRLYRAAHGEHLHLPEVLIRYLPPLLDVGYRILKNQEDLIVPPEGLQVVNANDLACVRSWQAGIIGEGRNPHRSVLMRRFFEFVQQNGGEVPNHARSLVFESLAHFALEFAEQVELGVDSAEFVRGISHVLSGFLISSQRMEPEPRLDMARALMRIFACPVANILCDNEAHRLEIAKELEGLVKTGSVQDFDAVLGHFLKRPAISSLFKNVGLAPLDKPLTLPDAFH
jgi:hypothetical protein